LDFCAASSRQQQRAANLDAYKAQLGEMERNFGPCCGSLPGKTEVPNLLVDISQTGLGAGLQEKALPARRRAKQGLLRRAAIRIRLVGSYHEFGTFVSGIAACPAS